MSLKAKLEAVVYAAEEPVTLAQLATIFAEEVLHQLEAEPVDKAEADFHPELAPEPEAEQVTLSGVAVEATTESVVVDEAPSLPSVDEPAPAETAVESVPEDEKKVARQRDRQVRQVLQQVLDELIADYAGSQRGMEIREIAGGYRMATKPEYHDAVRGFVKSLKPPMKLSLQALETLAVIAYKQPVTAPEVSEIRGVDSAGVLGGLVSRKLITTAGRKPVIGRPILYKTTKEFLLRFGLKDVNDLPSMEEFEKMAGELADSEAEADAQDSAGQPGENLFAPEGASPEHVPEEYVAAETEATPEPVEQLTQEAMKDGNENPSEHHDENPGEEKMDDHVLTSPGIAGES